MKKKSYLARQWLNSDFRIPLLLQGMLQEMSLFIESTDMRIMISKNKVQNLIKFSKILDTPKEREINLDTMNDILNIFLNFWNMINKIIFFI